jgi:hypothetical protein
MSAAAMETVQRMPSPRPPSTRSASGTTTGAAIWLMPPPASATVAPGVTIESQPSFYVQRIDIEAPGDGYNRPPKVVIQGTSQRPAVATASIRDGQVSEIRVTDIGAGYTETPCVILEDVAGGRGEGAAVQFTLDGALAAGDYKSGIEIGRAHV